MNRSVIDIKGMHCTSCELLIEDELLSVPNVKKATVNHVKGCATIYFNGTLNDKRVSAAIQKAGYTIGKEERPVFSRNIEDYKEFGIAVSAFVIVWSIAYTNGWFTINTSSLTDYASLPIVLLIGLTAGISTCMALVGGLVLGASARFSQQHPTATRLQKFTPHILFNAGRIFSFFVFGGIIGYAGSFMTFSPGILGSLIIIVGIVMTFLGAQLINLFPFMSGLSVTMPKRISSLFGIRNQNNPAILGGLTFFLPCGFTQAMQLYAMSTGSALTGALTMGVFAIGTAPGLLAVGGLTSVVQGLVGRIFFKFAGVVVIAMALFNITNGIRLTGGSVLPAVSGEEERIQDRQLITATYSAKDGFQPKELTVQAGVPTRLEVEAFDAGAGCMGSITLPGLSKKIDIFKKGAKTVFEFTTPRPGEYTIACAMGLPHGTIKAV